MQLKKQSKDIYTDLDYKEVPFVLQALKQTVGKYILRNNNR